MENLTNISSKGSRGRYIEIYDNMIFCKAYAFEKEILALKTSDRGIERINKKIEAYHNKIIKINKLNILPAKDTMLREHAAEDLARIVYDILINDGHAQEIFIGHYLYENMGRANIYTLFVDVIHNRVRAGCRDFTIDQAIAHWKWRLDQSKDFSCSSYRKEIRSRANKFLKILENI